MHIPNRLTASQECQRRLLVPLLWQQMIWKREEYSIVIIVSFVEEKAAAFVCHNFNVLFVSKLAKHIEGFLCGFRGPV